MIIPTSCAHDCGGKCPLLMEVHRGRVTSIKDAATVNQTVKSLGLKACGRGLTYTTRLHHPQRLLHPLERRGPRGGGDFKKISWEDALDTISSKLEYVKEEYGNQAFLHMGGSGSYSALLHDTARLTSRFLNMLGGCIELHGSYSYEAAKIASLYTYGTDRTDHAREDLPNAKTIIMWGWNPLETFFGSNTRTYLHAAKEAGSTLVCIDPRRTPTAEFAHQWIPIKPGTDVALASAMAHVIIRGQLYDEDFVERYVDGFPQYAAYITGAEDGVAKTPQWASPITGIPVSTIEELARTYAAKKPAALIPGWGPQRTAYGEQFTRATAALASLTGNIGIPGGNPAGAGIGPGPTHAEVALPTGDNPLKLSAPRNLWPDLILKSVEGGYPADVKAAYVVGSDYLNQQGNANKSAQALKKLDFTVVHEHFLTPTASYADIVLPAAMFPERSDIILPWAGQGRYIVFQNKAVDPPPDVKTDLQIFTELAGRLGFAERYNPCSEEQWLKGFAQELGVRDYEEFKRSGIRVMEERPTIPFRPQIEEGKPFPTPSGRIKLYSQRLADLKNPLIPPIPKYMTPWEGTEEAAKEGRLLQLITPKNLLRIHSSIPDAALTERKLNRAWISPADAKAAGVSAGDAVKIHNQRGAVVAEAYVTGKIIQGVISLEEGAWYDPDETGLDRGGCANSLTSDTPTPLAKAATTHSTLVYVEAMSSRRVTA